MIRTYWSTKQGRYIPITEREIIPDAFFHHGKRIGDIVMREATISPLIICDYETLDDGSGAWGFVFFRDNSYQVIGSIYEKGGIELIMPMLNARNRSFDYDSYGLKFIQQI